jgi:hypothetical protein
VRARAHLLQGDHVGVELREQRADALALRRAQPLTLRLTTRTRAQPAATVATSRSMAASRIAARWRR